MEPEILTHRELEIVARIVTGQTSKEIAQHLCISHFTVRKHRENVLRKLGLHNAAQLTAYAIRYDLLRRPRKPDTVGRSRVFALNAYCPVP